LNSDKENALKELQAKFKVSSLKEKANSKMRLFLPIRRNGGNLKLS
jgi:hypothetical protein